MEKKPEWLKVRYNQDAVNEVAALMRDLKLKTGCGRRPTAPIWPSAYQKHTSTFMILGSVCTRNCRFCNVVTDAPCPLPRGTYERGKGRKKTAPAPCGLDLFHTR